MDKRQSGSKTSRERGSSPLSHTNSHHLPEHKQSSTRHLKHRASQRQATEEDSETNTSSSIVIKDKHDRYIEAFYKMDLNKNGLISKEEFRRVFDKFSFGNNWTHEKMNTLFDEIDDDGSGTISLENFLNALEKKPVNRDLTTMVNEILHDKPVFDNDDDEDDKELREEWKKILKEENRYKRIEQYNKMGPEKYALKVLDIDQTHYKRYYKAFSLLDIDGNGDIEKEELVFLLDKFSLGTHLSKQELNDLFAELDKGDDGEINFMDFLESLRGENPNKALLGIISGIHGKSKEIKQYKVEQNEKKRRGEFDFSDLKISETDFKRYIKVFDEMDTNLNGLVSKDEFDKVLSVYLKDKNLSQEEINNTFFTIDHNHDGSINLYEFLKGIEQGECQLLVNLVKTISEKDKDVDPIAYAKNVLHIPEYQIKKYQKAFDIIDLNGNGSISKNEFEDVVRAFSLLKNVTSQYVGDFYNTIDMDLSGEISLLDFFKSLGSDKPLKKLAQMIDTIISKEKDIAAYAKQKGLKRAKAPSFVNKSKQQSLKTDEKKEEVVSSIDMSKSVKVGKVSEKDTLRKDIEELRRIIIEKDGVIAKKDEENRSLLKKRQELEEVIKKYEKDLEALNEERVRWTIEKEEGDEIKKLIENMFGKFGQQDGNKNVKYGDLRGQAEKYLIFLQKIQLNVEENINLVNNLNIKLTDVTKEKDETKAKWQKDVNEIVTLRKEQVGLNDRLIKVEEEKAKIQTELTILNGALEQDKQELKAQLEGKEGEIGKLRVVNKDTTEEITRLNNRLSLMIPKDELEKIIKEKAEIKNEADSVRLLVLSLEGEKRALEAEINQSKSRVVNLEGEQETIKNTLKESQTQLEEYKSKNTRSELEIKDLNTQIKNQLEELEKVRKLRDEFSSENDILRKTLEKVNLEKGTIQIERNQLTERIQEVERQRNEFKLQLEEKENLLNNVNKKLAEISKEKEENELKWQKDASDLLMLRKEQQSVTEKLTLVQQERIQDQRIQSELTVLKQSLEQEKQELKVQVDAKEVELVKLRASNNESFQEISRLNQQLSTMIPRDEFEKILQEKGDMKTDTENIRVLTLSLESEKKALEVEHSQSKKKIGELEEEKDRLANTLLENQGQLEDLRNKLTNNLLEIQGYNNQISHLKIQLEELGKVRIEKDELLGNNESLHKTLERVTNEKNQIEIERNQLIERTQEIERQREEFRLKFEDSSRQINTVNARLNEVLKDKEENYNKWQKDIAELSLLKNEQKTLTERLNQIEQERAKDQKVQSELTVVQSSLEKEGAGLRMQLKNKETELARLKASQNDSFEQITKLNQQMSTMIPKEEFEKVVKEKTVLKNETEQVRVLTLSLEKEKKSLEAETSLLKRKIIELEEDKERILNKSTETQTQLEESKAKVIRSILDLQFRNHEISSLKAQLEDLEKIRKELDDLLNESNNLRDQKNQVEAERNQLLEQIQEIIRQREEAKLYFLIRSERAFLLLNLYHDGPLRKDDFAEVAKTCGLLPDEQIPALFEELSDENKGEQISIASFLKAMNNEYSVPRYGQFIDIVLHKEQEIVAFKAQKMGFENQERGWVERSRDMDLRRKMTLQQDKARVFSQGVRNERTEDLFLTQDEVQDILKEDTLKTEAITESDDTGTWQTRPSDQEIYKVASFTRQVHENHPIKARAMRMVRDNEEDVLESSNRESREIKLERATGQFFRAVGSNRPDPKVQEELMTCLRSLSDEELDRMASLSGVERINYLSSVKEQYKERERQQRGQKSVVNFESLEKVIEEGKKYAARRFEKMKRKKMVSLFCLNQFINNFNLMFYSD